MKKIITLLAFILAVHAAQAQDSKDTLGQPETFRIGASIFTVGLFMIFILAILKKVLEHRLKNKIVDKGIPENVVSSILQSNHNEGKEINIKWFALLAGTGAGLIIVNYTHPLGIHSLAIMALSISFSFLGYYFFLRQSDKK